LGLHVPGNNSTVLCWTHVQVRTKQLDIAGAEEQVARLEGLLKEAKGATDKVQKEFNALSEKVRAADMRLLCGICAVLLSKTRSC
jgi:hypothetical protein